MARIYKTPVLRKNDFSWCAGCGHGVITKLILETLEEMGLERKCMYAGAVGCTCLLAATVDIDMVQAQHGRAAAVAAGMKHIRPDSFVFAYQGDGDAASIGLSETLYAAKRNDPITVFFVNNGVFGMTGGQAAPTSLEGQYATTAQHGVDYSVFGKPMHLAEMIASFDVGYVARGSIANIREIRQTKEYIKKAIECQMNGGGYSFVEILSPCPTNWKMSPVDSLKRIEEVAMEHFKCGVLKG